MLLFSLHHLMLGMYVAGEAPMMRSIDKHQLQLLLPVPFVY